MLTSHLSLHKSGPLRVLFLGAHSDDIEIGCGGTILKLKDTYSSLEVTWIVFGAEDATRAHEAEKSAKKLTEGVKLLDFRVMSYRDGFFPIKWAEIKEEFEEIKKQISPDVIFTHYRCDLHQDHKIISELTWNTFRSHFILEYEIPKYDGDFGSPNFFVHLRREDAEGKVRHLMNYFPSQSGKGWFTEDTFFSVMRIRGIECASKNKYSEAFYCKKASIF